MDRWLVEMIFSPYNTLTANQLTEVSILLGTFLKRKPDLYWVLLKRSSLIEPGLQLLLSVADDQMTDEVLYQNMDKVLEAFETDIIYMEPNLMHSRCDYIVNWKPETLYDLVDLSDKVVLDLGAGTGRLTFAAAKKALRVYASEPVDRLREYLKDQVKTNDITNVKVLDGVVMNIPFEDNTFDVILAGHVVGDDYDKELEEMTRVLKPMGKIVLCNGEDPFKRSEPNQELVKRGFTVFYHQSVLGGDIYNYTKVVKKPE